MNRKAEIVECIASWFILIPEYRSFEIRMGKKISQLSLLQYTYDIDNLKERS
jgi:hypothetical protein